jgi:FKBP-type peptidyl-prolyl cis-trans isomerase FkpA
MRGILIFLNLTLFVVLILVGGCKKDKIYDYNKWLTHDDAIIDQYLADSGITNVIETNSGLRIVNHILGFGSYPVSGQTVRINYEGRLLDGTIFDSSYDSQTAFQFPIGYGYVISGMDEGVQYIRERGSATIYVPSPLAYQDQSYGDIIKPNSILVFDIVLLSIQK